MFRYTITGHQVAIPTTKDWHLSTSWGLNAEFLLNLQGGGALKPLGHEPAVVQRGLKGSSMEYLLYQETPASGKSILEKKGTSPV